MLSRSLRVGIVFMVAQMIVVTCPVISALPLQRPYRVTDAQMDQLLQRIELRANTFRASLDLALDRSRWDATRQEDDINAFLNDYVAAADRLHERFNAGQHTTADVQEVLNRSMHIDDFMKRHRLAGSAERDWLLLRSDLSLLASYHGLSWQWDSPPYGEARNRLTGTYRLDVSRSDNAWNAARRATRGLSAQQKQRLRQFITARLTAPEMLAIDQNGRSVVVASSRAPQVAFEADGRDRIETNPRGRSVRVNALLTGNRLLISSAGDRGNDFSVAFEPIYAGRQLRVTRQMNVETLSLPITVSSIYDRTAEVAQLDLPREIIPASGADVGANREASYVPDNTELVASLNDSLSTSRSRSGDRVTLTVLSPSRYEGAVIDGQVVRSSRPGLAAGRAEMSLKFDRIRLRNGSSHDFDGYIVSVTTPNGEDVRVDSEGSVSEETTQGKRTLTRSGIGAAIGAVIGALAGGGKGAAVGAAIGAGAGAGSVFVQGRDDLELDRGTQFRIRSVAPRFSNP